MALAVCACGGGGGGSGNGTSGAQSPTPTPTPTPTPPPPPLQNLPAWVAPRAVGEWFQIPNTAMSSVDPSPVPPGNTGPQSKVVAWTSMVVDTRTSKLYSVANGGHSDYSGNEVDELTLEVDAPTWVQRLAPTPAAQVQQGPYYLDGRPAARHTYYGVTLNTFDDRIMLFGGSQWSNGGSTSALSSYNIGANFYSSSSTHPNIPNSNLDSAAAANPLTGDVYYLNDQSLRLWSRASNTWTTLSPSGSTARGHQSLSAMDTTTGRQRILFVGGCGIAACGEPPDHHLYTIASNAWSTVTITGANAADVMSAGQDAMVYVPDIDRFLVRKGGAGGTVYQINPTTFEATAYPTTGGTAIPATQNGPYNKFLYVPRLGGVIYVPTYNGNAWFMRIR